MPPTPSALAARSTATLFRISASSAVAVDKIRCVPTAVASKPEVRDHPVSCPVARVCVLRGSRLMRFRGLRLGDGNMTSGRNRACRARPGFAVLRARYPQCLRLTTCALEGGRMKIVPIALVVVMFAALVAGASARSDRAPVLLCISSQSYEEGQLSTPERSPLVPVTPGNRAASISSRASRSIPHAEAARQRWVAPGYLTGACCGSATTAGRLLSSRSARPLDHSIARRHAHRAPRIR